MNLQMFSLTLRVSAILLTFTVISRGGQSYDLSHVDGIESFGGSGQALDLLATNGFVVAAPDFRQIFEPYIESQLPVLITVDSAWHTYHFLLEQGIKELEFSQSAKLASFSRLLLAAASEQVKSGASEFVELQSCASIGLAFQDDAAASKLNDEQKRMLNALVSGETSVAAPIGFELSPVNFRPQSFYAESPKLAAYYRARQWYACVDFRLSDDRETRLALCLSWLIHSQPDLMNLWRELNSPFDAFVAPADDSTVSDYLKQAEGVLGANFDLAALNHHAPEIVAKLRDHPKLPRVNDQLLSPDDYAQFPQVTAGFRLLPARQLPCAVCLQNSVEPKVKGRLCPSGLDFFTASTVLRSPAALRAERKQCGEAVLADILKADPGPMPDSLYGQSLMVLKTLQQPLPAQIPSPLRSEAWADLKLWTQLGAWAEQRHTWALHAKPAVSFLGGAETPPGIVEPYPNFFVGLAKLSRATSQTLEGCQPREPFDPKKAAAGVLEAKALSKTIRKLPIEGSEDAEKLRQYGAFTRALWRKGRREISDDDLKRMAESGPTNQDEVALLRTFYDAKLSIPRMLMNFAAVCDRLAILAGKEFNGELPNQEEATWISGYGIRLAGFHFYSGNSWLAPIDDFSILSRVFDIPVKGTVLYAAVARPQALYVILPYKDRQQLYRGAVLSYREFERPEAEDLSDKAWQERVRQTNAPSAPRFTTSFLRADAPDPAQAKRLSALSFAESDLAKPSPSPPIKVTLTQTLLSPIANVAFTRFHDKRMMSSDNERHVILVETKDGKQRLVRDGVPGKLYDSVEFEWFGPDCEHVVYVAKQKDRCCVVKDGVEGKSYADIQPLRNDAVFVFSSNCVHFAYEAAMDSGQKCIVLDGVEGSLYDKILEDSFSFSANSSHYAYEATRGTKGFVVKDNQVAVECDADGWNSVRQGPYLSPDGQRLACFVKRGSQWFANVDGKDSHPWKRIDNDSRTGLSANGSHFSYSAEDNDGFSVIVDDREFPDAGIEPAVFSPNGRSWAVVNEDETGSWVVVNGKAGKKYNGNIYSPTFSPNGRRLGYLVESYRGGSRKMAVIHGEREFENMEPVLFGGIQFSPDSAHYAITGTRGRKPVVIIDGKQYPAADKGEGGTPVIFSPNSEHWAYLAFHDGRLYWVVSGVEYGPYGTVPKWWLDENLDEDEEIDSNELMFCFSPNGRHFVFRATRDGRRLLVVDGLEREVKDDWFPHSSIVFDSPDQFRLITCTEREIHLVTGTIEPNP